VARIKDHTGREWNLRLTTGILPDLRAAGCDLSEAVKSGSWLGELLFSDVERIGGIAWVMLAEQATSAGIDRAGFDQLLDCDFVDAIAAGLEEEIIGFFHRGRRKHLQAQLPKITAKMDEEMSRIASEAAEKAIAAMDAKARSMSSDFAGS